MRVPYTPPREVLDRYASVLVDFALGGGRGVQAGEVVRVVAPESAKPLYAALNRAVWRAGGHVIGAYQPDDDADVNLSRDFYESAGAEQLDHFPARYTRGLIDEIDHQVTVIAPSDPRALDSVDPARDHAPRRDDAPAAGLARREGERRALLVDAGPLRHAGDGCRGRHRRRVLLAADHRRLLPRQR